MDPFESDALKYMRQNGMTRPGSKIIAAVSGGADSVCLFFVLRNLSKILDISFLAAHVEHGIRGEESLSDARFVRSLCEKYGVPFLLCREDVPALAAREHLTEEEAGRQVRYAFFERCRKECGAERIATAHNADDQAETVLFHMARGSDLEGLTGIRPVRGTLIRPLLFAPRSEIEAYLRRMGQDFVTDRTNLDPAYARNRIRLRVLPELRAVNPLSAEHICREAESLSEVADYLARETRRAYEGCLIAGRGLSCEKLGELDPVIRSRVLRMSLLRLTRGAYLKDFTARHIEILKNIAAGPDGRQADLPRGILAIKHSGVLTLENACAKSAEDTKDGMAVLPIYLENGGTWQVGDWEIEAQFVRAPFVPSADSDGEKQFTKWLYYDTIVGQSEKLVIRTRKSGDYLVLDQEGRKKKLSRYLIDRKVPADMRDRVLVIADGEHILWVVGGRISEDAKIRKTGDRCLKITARRRTLL